MWFLEKKGAVKTNQILTTEDAAAVDQENVVDLEKKTERLPADMKLQKMQSAASKALLDGVHTASALRKRRFIATRPDQI